MTQFTTIHRAVLAALTSLAAFGAQAAMPAANHPAVQQALTHLKGQAAAAGQVSASDTFKAKDLVVDADGAQHVRLDRLYKGLRVIGGDLVVHGDANGRFHDVSISLAQRIAVDVKAALPSRDAATRALAAFPHKDGKVDSQSLVIYAREGLPQLARDVVVTGVQADGTPSRLHVLVGAQGRVLDRWDDIKTADDVGQGKTLYSGNVPLHDNFKASTGKYTLKDVTRGKHYVVNMNHGTFSETKYKSSDNVWGNNATSDRASAAADAHYGVAATWDYYKNVHGRNGIFNDGRGVKSYVHYGPTNLVNAYWDGTAMLYGDGDGVTYRPLVALDVAGHEMTHGVTGATARLGYYNIKDSGGINEGISDIFGTLVEFSVANANDPGDYLLGEEVYISNPGDKKALRQMFKQDADGASKVCYPVGGFATGTQARGPNDPHFTSGVLNRVFYLGSEGANVPAGFNYTKAQMVCNGDTSIVGIGRDKMGAIMYRALTRYFVSSTTYPQARTWTLQAATDLYGANSAEYTALARVWSAVNVN